MCVEKIYKCYREWKPLSHVQLFATPWTIWILQAGILEWVAIPFSRVSSQPRDQTQVSTLQTDSLPAEPPGNPNVIEASAISKPSCLLNLVTILFSLARPPRRTPEESSWLLLPSFYSWSHPSSQSDPRVGTVWTPCRKGLKAHDQKPPLLEHSKECFIHFCPRLLCSFPYQGTTNQVA